MKELLKHLDNVGKRNYQSSTMIRWKLQDGSFSVIKMKHGEEYRLRKNGELQRSQDIAVVKEWLGMDGIGKCGRLLHCAKPEFELKSNIRIINTDEIKEN